MHCSGKQSREKCRLSCNDSRKVFAQVQGLGSFKSTLTRLYATHHSFRLRAHVYVFKKTRFRKDPFWGVHTYRTSIRRPRSHGRGLIPGNVPPPVYICSQRRTRLELKPHFFFCLFSLLASVVLLYCFTCLCPEEGVYVVWESWRQVIKEMLQRRNEAKTKDEATWNKNKTPDLRLRRRRGRVASEDNSDHTPFCFGRQLPSKQKEMLPVSATRLQMRKKHIHRLGKPFLITLETVAEKIWIPCSHAKKIRIRNLRFRKILFRERFRKAPFGGTSVFKKLRIRADTCDRFYVSGVEKLRFRKDPGTCARSLSLPKPRQIKERALESYSVPPNHVG